MNSEYTALLQEKMSQESYSKLIALDNKKLVDFVGKFVAHCKPESVYMCDDSAEDQDYVRKIVLEKSEEAKLAKPGQTIHYDNYYDQARDKANTKYLVKKENLASMKSLNSVEYEEGYDEIMGIANGIMKGKDAVCKLFVEGPPMSEFSRPCVQLTDSWYVAHSEQILYRGGYEHFKQMQDKNDFYRFIHSAGEVDQYGCTVNLDQRRIYMDTNNMIVYSMNDQYGGNSIGLKKHAMRLAIKESREQGWLCEHMFIMACVNQKKSRKTYFCGAYPSACGKTSTAMIPGEEVVGDDIAYFRNIDGEFRAVNVEQGIFGIIKDVNQEDDPFIYENLKKPQELIISNVLTGPDNEPYWLGMGEETPKEGRNHSGPGWYEGKKDADGRVIPLAHSNARYTMRLDYLENFDREGFNNPKGVLVSGIIYGGRDSDTAVPCQESFDWEDGILSYAVPLESETTSATLGQEGVRKASPMANLDFLSYPLGEYIEKNINFGKAMKQAPKIFATNYFLLTPEGKFCTSKLAKKVWLHWFEGRINGDYEAYTTPTGYIPKYEDLKVLFKELLDEDYTEEDYRYQFTFRCDAIQAKYLRAIEFANKMDANMPQFVIDKWNSLIDEIKKAKEEKGALIEPGK
jgi:phosphoenolpyruvate carboxykinase (GTP)